MMTRNYWQTRQQLLKAQAQSHAELRRRIRLVLQSNSRPMSVAELGQALPQETQAAIQRELYVLSRHPKSDLWHNGMRGRGSLYGIGLKLLETVEE